MVEKALKHSAQNCTGSSMCGMGVTLLLYITMKESLNRNNINDKLRLQHGHQAKNFYDGKSRDEAVIVIYKNTILY
jgi:hypothetical protein